MTNERSMQEFEAEGAKKCPECGSTDLEKREGEIYCRKCGLVID